MLRCTAYFIGILAYDGQIFVCVVVLDGLILLPDCAVSALIIRALHQLGYYKPSNNHTCSDCGCSSVFARFVRFD
jgi:hypothetical protein